MTVVLSTAAAAEELVREIDLRGEWKFEIGDNLDYAAPDFNDSRWEKIRVPAAWENEGYPGYNGYAWYRISLIIPERLRNKLLYLKLGQIDDVDRTYFNGRLIGGEGDFPSQYRTAFNVNRLYQIPTGLVQFGRRNVLAVRVFDLQGVGGIVHGEVGIYSNDEILPLLIDLSGLWRFKSGDDPQWSINEFDDSLWRLITVPGTWEQQGFSRSGCYGWYRKTFLLDRLPTERRLILMLGKIREMDQVFLNGVQIGETGLFQNTYSENNGTFKDVERAYFVPPHLLRAGKNTIAVRVYDSTGQGGIYWGFVGICTRNEFLRRNGRKSADNR